jgi:hypothetical protein
MVEPGELKNEELRTKNENPPSVLTAAAAREFLRADFFGV